MQFKFQLVFFRDAMKVMNCICTSEIGRANFYDSPMKFRAPRSSILQFQPPNIPPHGFTLIELLVVIALIAVLAMIAFAAAGRFADSGKQAVTAGRLRQVHVLQMAFAQDNNGRLTPRWGDTNFPNPIWTWQQKLFPYLNLESGNSRADPKLVLNSPYQKNLGNQATFGLNSWMFSTIHWNYYINRVPEPSKIILAGDMEQADLDYMFTSDGFDGWGNSPSWAKRPAYRHAGKKKAMMLFMDGHTELLGEEELKRQPSDGSASRWRWWQ